jgi:hypothetical protein
VCQALGGLDDDDPRVVELAAQLSEISCWPTSQLARLEAAFVLLAQQLPGTELRAALGLLVDALLPDELEKRAARAADEAQVSLRPNSDGSGWLLRGELDLETGELLHTALTAMHAVDPDNPIDTDAAEKLRASGWEFGDPFPPGLAPSDQPVPRSRGRRLHDALRLGYASDPGQRRARRAGQDRTAHQRDRRTGDPSPRPRRRPGDRRSRHLTAAQPDSEVVVRRVRHPLRPRARTPRSWRPVTAPAPSRPMSGGSSMSRPAATAKAPAAAADLGID